MRKMLRKIPLLQLIFSATSSSTGIETSARQLANVSVKYFWRVKAMALLPDPASVKF